MTNKTSERLINWWLSWDDLNWPNIDIKEKIKKEHIKLQRQM